MKPATTVGELRQLIKDLPDNMIIVAPGSDHSYNLTNVQVVKAAEIKYHNDKFTDGTRGISYMWEYYDEGNRSLKSTKIKDVLLVGYG